MTRTSTNGIKTLFLSSFEVPDVMKEKKEFTFKVIIIVFAVCVGSVLLCYFLRRKYISKRTLYVIK